MHQRRVNPALIALSVAALLAQLVLTAAHLHLADLGRAHGIIAVSYASHDDGTPTTPIDGDEIHCTLCWAHAVSGSLLVPAAAALPPPPLFHAAPHRLAAHPPVVGASARAFHPRAPPATAS